MTTMAVDPSCQPYSGGNTFRGEDMEEQGNRTSFRQAFKNALSNFKNAFVRASANLELLISSRSLSK